MYCNDITTKFNSISSGTLAARTAIAQANNDPAAPLTANDVILANGCSGALEMCINVLCNEGQNILLPRPGFSLYASVAATRFVEPRYYNLLVKYSSHLVCIHC